MPFRSRQMFSRRSHRLVPMSLVATANRQYLRLTVAVIYLVAFVNAVELMIDKLRALF